jgi:2C-methyl-D-erythritol 2,4-cyclodiphosphate synthase
MVVDALCKILLDDANPQVRVKAAESLGKLGYEDAIPALCEAWLQDKDINVRFQAADALVIIINPESIKTMSETPKYDFRGSNIGNFADKVEGNQIANQNINISGQQQNIAEAAKEIQDLLAQLQQTNPTITEAQKQAAIVKNVQQQIKQNPTLRDRLWSAFKSGGIEALKQALDAIYKNPLVSISVETVKGFLEAECKE